MVLLREKIWQFLPLGIDLYNGLAGIALFLAYLGRASGERKYDGAGAGAPSRSSARRSSQREAHRHQRRLHGLGRPALPLHALYGLWREPRLLEEALFCARQMRLRAETDEDFEILYGNAVASWPSTASTRCIPTPRCWRPCGPCGQRIVSQARPMARGWGGTPSRCGPVHWRATPTAPRASRPALESLYRANGGQGLSGGGRRPPWPSSAPVLPRERATGGTCGPIRRTARRMRQLLRQVPYRLVQRCSGRRAVDGCGCPRSRVPRAARRSRRPWPRPANEGFGYTHCLCHGDLGNLELLLEAREAGRRPGRRERSRAVLRRHPGGNPAAGVDLRDPPGR